MPGGSAAPIENSPPGIQIMPFGALPGAVVAFACVGRNTGAADASGTGDATRGAAGGAWANQRQPATPTAAIAMSSVTTHGVREPRSAGVDAAVRRWARGVISRARIRM